MYEPLCRNCNAPLTGAFCSECGQRDLPLKESFWSVLGRAGSEFFAFDSRIGRTFRPFLLSPGFLTREYNLGRRSNYSAPFRLYILSVLFLFLILGFQQRVAQLEKPRLTNNRETEAASGKSENEPNVEFDLGDNKLFKRILGEDSKLYALWIEQREAFEALPPSEQVDTVIAGALSQAPTLLLLMLPLAALFLRLAYLRTGFVYAEHFTFVLHVHAFYALVLLVPALTLHSAGFAFAAAAIPAYFILALRTAYAGRWPSTLVRAALLAPLYLVTLIPLFVALFFLAVINR